MKNEITEKKSLIRGIIFFVGYKECVAVKWWIIKTDFVYILIS